MKSSRFSFHLVLAIFFGFTVGIILAGAQPIHLTAPEKMVASLSRAVGLTPEQQVRAGEIFRKETSALLAIPEKERFQKGDPIRQAAREEIKAMLTPKQWVVYAITPQVEGGGSNINAKAMTARLDTVVSLSPEQKARVLEIYQRFAEDVAMIPEDKEHFPQRIDLRQAAQAKVRALLTPAQQQKSDSAPKGGSGGSTTVTYTTITIE
ncbi:MAG TPA: hypothetical protein VHO24_12285 [Opitutaceae bacterium]|nr:hypothetical protein [Opitutaceae bacterium]